ncbi:MAG: ribosome maturation factor RimP [Legionellales bacterium]|nr:ribosome maturation factor RimP [Legionellales bacterium]
MWSGNLSGIATNIAAMIESTVSAEGFELLGCEYMPRGRQSLLRLYIDKDTGITIDDCEKVSRRVSALLDVEDPIHGEYLLEVSSPGIEKPLFKLAHYAKHQGQSVKIRLHVPLAGNRHVTGKIVRVNDNAVTLNVNDEEIQIPFDNISKGKLVALLG